MKTACVAALATVASTSAFLAPMPAMSVAKSSSSLNMAYEGTPGVTAPLGYFDPLGILADADDAKFFQWRSSEIKHGRIAQLAVVGYLAQEAFRFPGTLGYGDNAIAFADIPNGLAAFSKISGLGIAQLFFFIGYLEYYVVKQQEGSFPGDVGFPGPYESYDAEKQLEYRNKEINQGRAAMMGIAAMVTHESIDGHPYVIQDTLKDLLAI